MVVGTEVVAMSVTLKRVKNVWQVGRLDGTTETHDSFAAALVACEREWTHALYDAVGFDDVEEEWVN